jgi:predicted GNAT family N-acyltransferase
MALQQRGITDQVRELSEHRNIHERGLLELNDKMNLSMKELGDCAAIAKKSMETSTQSFTIARESQSENMRASRTAQQMTQEALTSLKERIDKQDSEIRSQRLEEVGRRLNDIALQQRNISDQVGELGERGSVQERGLQELNDKMKRSMRELSDCTAMATKSMETSAQSFTVTRDFQAENMRMSRAAQQTVQEALASLNERIDKQGSEIRSLYSVRKPVDYEGLLDRQRMDGDRINDRISDLLAQLKTAHLEISDVKVEVSQKLQEIGRKLQEVSDSRGANHHSFERAVANLSNGLQTCQSGLSKLAAETTQSTSNLVSGLAESVRSQSGTDRRIAEIKLLVTSMEARIQSVAEDIKDKLDTSRLHSALIDLQAQRPDRTQEICQPDSLTAIISRSEGLTTEILSLEKRITETLSETNEAKAEPSGISSK